MPLSHAAEEGRYRDMDENGRMEMKKAFQCYERIEIRLPDEVERVEFEKPDGKVEQCFPFMYQPIEVDYDEEGIEKIRKSGAAYAMCRYTPDMCGGYKITLFSGKTLLERTRITVSGCENHGYIEISRKDKRYFSYTDGSPFFAVGINLAFPSVYGRSNGEEFGLSEGYRFIGLKQYERWFKQCSENGINVARIWLGHQYFNPDTQNTYEYDLTQFSKIDEVLKLAKKYGIRLKFTFEQFRFFDYVREALSASYEDDIFRKFNKRLYDAGNRCENTREWLKETKWEKAWLSKMMEFAKRYSGDTSIFMLELWNEMNCVGGYEEIMDWNQRILPQVKSLFPRQLVTNSLGSLDHESSAEFYKGFCWEKCDVIQFHRYLDQGAGLDSCKENPIEMVREGFAYFQEKDKPVFLAETGAVNDCHSGPFRYYVNDHRGMLLADCVYMPVFLKSCGVGNMWHWDERYIEAKNLYRLYRPVKNLVEEIDFPAEDFSPLDASSDKAYVYAMRGKTVMIGYVRNKEDNWKTVLRDLKEPEPLQTVVIDVEGYDNLVLYDIWGEEGLETEINAGKLIMRNVKYGILFKIFKKK